MSARVLGLRALPVTFLIFVIEALFAAFASWPNGVELTAKLSSLSLDPSALRELGAIAKGFARGHGLAVLAMLVLAPWLHMSWLIMLSEPQSPARALARGVGRVPRAWLIALVLLVMFALCGLPFVGLAYGVTRSLSDAPDARRHDLALAGALLPLIPLAFYFHVANDLARAAALEVRTLRSIFRGLRTALRPTAFLAASGAALVGVLLPLAAHASSWQLGVLPATMLLQSVLFMRLVVRAAWLGHALALVRPTVVVDA
ncbi:MAG TPA: hypothetical protein VFX59_29085 [Polyangiales bacterium]|nr:hypothetical protein [Polyangiales bacterium]